MVDLAKIVCFELEEEELIYTRVASSHAIVKYKRSPKSFLRVLFAMDMDIVELIEKEEFTESQSLRNFWLSTISTSLCIFYLLHGCPLIIISTKFLENSPTHAYKNTKSVEIVSFKFLWSKTSALQLPLTVLVYLKIIHYPAEFRYFSKGSSRPKSPFS